MAKFCTNCGKKLKDGEVCNCKKVEISTKDFNSYMTSLLNVLKGMFVKPIDTLKSFIDDSNFVLALIILLIAALSTSAMTLVLIKQLYGQIGLLGGGMMGLALSSVEIPYVKFFFITLFASIVVYFILAGMLYLVGSSILKGVGQSDSFFHFPSIFLTTPENNSDPSCPVTRNRNGRSSTKSISSSGISAAVSETPSSV